jgi:hypothetical protein
MCWRKLPSWHVGINVVDNLVFHEWTLYGHNNLTERDSPHRTKLIEMIFREYEQEHQKVLGEFEVK